MKIIAGLGNPGLQYAATRHNCGFLTIDQLAEHLDVAMNKKEQDSLTATVAVRGEKLLLIKPQSFMNLSGYPICRLAGYYKVDIADILIISDDLALP
ncbi:MAG: aminoacyl-tRNA hydrolase, partial [Clostridiales bacterium]